MTKRLLAILGTVLLTMALTGVAAAVVGQTEIPSDGTSTAQDATTSDDDSSSYDYDEDSDDNVKDESQDSDDGDSNDA